MSPQCIALSTWLAVTLAQGAATAAPSEAGPDARDGRFGACVVAASPPKGAQGFFLDEARRALKTARPGDARVLLAELSKRLQPGQDAGLIPQAAEAMAEAGMTEDALRVAELAPSRFPETLVWMMEALSRTEPAKAEALFPRVMQALEEARYLVTYSDKPVRLIHVAHRAGTLAARGPEFLAWLTAEKDPYSRDRKLAEAAEQFAKVGALDLAMKAAEAATRTEPRADAFIHAAQGAVAMKDLATAGRALNAAESAIRSQKPDTFLPERLGRVALGWHQAGNKERSDKAFADAEQMAAGLSHLSVSGLAKVAASYGLAGRVDDVERLMALGETKAKTDPGERKDLEDFARQLTFADLHELALRAVAIAPEEDQTSALNFLIEDTVRDEKLDLALAAARKASRPEVRAALLYEVADALARKKEEGRALEAAHEALASAREAGGGRALGRVARVLARLGQADEALATARAVPEPLSKARAMTDVAQELSWRGDSKPRALAAAKEALSLADPIRLDTDDRDSLLSSLVYVAASSGDAALARKLAKKVKRDDMRPDVELQLRKYGPPAKALAALAKQPAGLAKARGIVDLAWGKELADDTAKALDALCARSRG